MWADRAIRVIGETSIIRPGGVEESGSLIIDDSGRIRDILGASLSELQSDGRVVDGRGLTVAPGFIDLQLNGAFGLDFTADPSAMWTVARDLPRFGVTSFLPTIVTAPWETYRQAQQALAAGPPAGFSAAQPLGLHFEGPFLNPARRGAHDPAYMRHPELQALQGWSPEEGVRMVTLAPELPGALEAAAELAGQGVVVSAGHSEATLEQAVAGFDRGICYGTHLFNAMIGIHHRRPGLAGALLSDDRVTVGLIADGIHVSPALVKVAWQVLGRRLNLVTDASAALGMAPGTYRLGHRAVRVHTEAIPGMEDGSTCLAARLSDGTLAGSVLAMDTAVHNLMRFAGCSLADAVMTVTQKPADLLGVRTGKIEAGYPADLVLLDGAGTVVMTIGGGKVVYEA